MSSAPVLLACIDAAAERLRDRLVDVKDNGAVDGIFDGGMSRACREYVRKAHQWEEQRKADAERRYIRQQEDEAVRRQEDFETLRRMVWREAKEKSRLYMPVRSELIPADLRMWAVQELRWSRAVMTRVYVYLVLREAMDHELAQRDPAESFDLQGDYGEATSLASQAREHRGEPRVMRVEQEDGSEDFVAVSDSPGRGLDLRRWDRPDRGLTVLVDIIETAAVELDEDLRTQALSTQVRRVERPAVSGKKRENSFSTFFIDPKKKRVFELTERGWFYQHMRVATAISQKLHQMRKYGLLQPITR